MQTILESPWIVGLMGLFVAGLCFFLWTQFGNRSWLAATVGVVVATVVMLIVSLSVRTDREQITEMLHDVGAALQRNDHAFVLARIHPQASEAVQRAKSELNSYHFTEARVTRIKSIEIDADDAVAQFNVMVNVKEFGRRVPRFVKVYLKRVNDRWLVRDYEHSDPTAGFIERR